jgi:hypothetical protein
MNFDRPPSGSTEEAEQKPKYTERELSLIRQRMISDGEALKSDTAELLPNGTLNLLDHDKVERDHRYETDPSFHFVSDWAENLDGMRGSISNIRKRLEGTTLKNLSEGKDAMRASARRLYDIAGDIYQKNQGHIKESLVSNMTALGGKARRLMESIEETELENVSARLTDLEGFVEGMTTGIGLMAPGDSFGEVVEE